MSVKIDSIQTISIGEANVGTATSGSSILASSTGYVNNFVNTIGLALNQSISYSISGIKTFTNSLTLIDGLGSSTTSIGTSIATAVNLLSSSVSNAIIVLNGFTQPLQVSNSTNTWSNALVIAPAQNSATPYTKLISGKNTTAGSGSVITFSPAFSVGCVPRVFINSEAVGTQLVVGAYNVTNVSFSQAGGGGTISWFALGY
jgi:hypothetical protein